jgi:hypothetical protein
MQLTSPLPGKLTGDMTQMMCVRLIENCAPRGIRERILSRKPSMSMAAAAESDALAKETL